MAVVNTNKGRNFFSERCNESILTESIHIQLTQGFQARCRAHKATVLEPSLPLRYYQVILFLINGNHLHTSGDVTPLLIRLALHGSQEDNFSKRDHLADDKPQVNQPDVRGGR